MKYNINIPKPVFEIINSLQKAGFEAYIVGGAVRDILTGKAVNDWDFTTNATPEEMLKIFKKAYYDNKFGTVGIPSPIPEERPYEITTFRTEHGYSDRRRPDKVRWGKSLEEDLSRRDFTINAMAFELIRNGQLIPDDTKSILQITARLIDNFHGQDDLSKKLIRTVGDPNKRFQEDALRMMRAIRIASEIGFTVDEDTLSAIRKNASLINQISKERIREEILKLISSKFPADGMLLLKNSGLMEIVLPELHASFGVEQKSPGRHHIFDVGTHSILSLKFVSERNSDPITRFATLIHDIGKPATRKVLENGTITFYNHEVVGGIISKRISKRLRFSKKDADKLFRLVRWHQFSVDEHQTDSAIRRFIKRVGKENIKDIIDLRIGDRLGGGAKMTSWRLEEYIRRISEVQKQPFSITDLRISGYDVMRIKKIDTGPLVGKILKEIFKKVVNKEIENKRDVLLKEIEKYGDTNS
jgi:tRNA nucleotidyltransferase/poly(A) polymerase